MTTGTSSPPPLPSSTPANRLVDERLARIGNTVKISDIGSGLMLWLAGFFSLVMLWVLIDHWIVGLPIWGRFVGLISLLGWTAFSWVRWVVPHIFRRINPAYAAHVAERANPLSRNRLLNFVLLRSERQRLREPVYRELEEQAHRQAREIDTEEAVDRSGLIRISMVAAGLFVLFGLYTAVSPKSPLATLARLLAPWKTIARPAKVHIQDVRPGSTTVYAGQTLEISAMVDKVSDDDSVWLVYSSVDEQIVDQRVLMKQDKSSGRFEATLPKPSNNSNSTGIAATGSRVGIRAHLDYRIEASDAVAGPFRVTVSPKPSLVVDRVEYDFPDYTDLPKESVDGLGDIKALEGTRVRIFATANQPIDTAYLEFDPGDDSKKRRTIRMQHDGLTANISFRLRLEPDRRTQLHESYQLRFTNAQHEINDRPILHQIDIDPDLPPIVEILQPATRVTDVPVNGAQLLEIRGLDPDFGLANMTLHGVARGRELFTPRALLNETSAGQVVRRLTFRPQKFELVEGDEVAVWASAFDNRFDVFEETAAPNVAENTPRYKLRIVAPVAQPNDGASEQGDGQAGGDAAGEGGDGEGGSGDADGSDESSGADSQNGESGQLSGEPGDEGSQSNGGDSTDGESGESGQGGEQQGGGQSGDSGESGSNSGNGQQGGESDQDSGGDEGGQGGDRMGESGEPSDSSRGRNSESGEGSNNGERGQEDGSAEAVEQSDRNDGSGSESQGGSNGVADPSGKGRPQDSANYDPNEPVPSDGSSDGDAFERVLDRMRELNGERSDGTPKSDPNEPDEPSEPNEAADSDESGGERGADGSDDANGDGSGDHGEEGSETGEPSSGGESPDAGDAESSGEPQDGSQEPEGALGDQSGEPSDQSNQSGENSSGNDGNSDQPSGGSEDSTPSGEGESGQSGESPQGSSGSPSPGSSKDGSSGESGTPSNEGGERGESGENGESGQSGSSDKPNDGGGSSEGGAAGAGESAGEGGGESGQRGAAGENGQGENGQGENGQGENGQGETGDSESGESGEPGMADSPQTAPGQADSESGENGENGGAEESGENGSSPESGSESGGSMEGGSNSAADGSPSDGGSSGGQTGGSSGGQPIGGGGENPSDNAPNPNDDGSIGDSSSDPANLDYTKKATDLALDYLKDQRDDPDPELLDRLGWTERELQQFLNRWESLQQSARKPKRGEANPDDFHDALRSLGLHPGKDRLRRGGLEDDQVQGVRDGGVRTKPPAEYDSLYKDFMRRRGKRDSTGTGAGTERQRN